METIKQVLMRRDGITSEEADELIDEAIVETASYLDGSDELARDPEEILHEDFGLEPDYVFELMPG